VGTGTNCANAEPTFLCTADAALPACAAFGESCSLPIPEIVAIGGQSDGKSSLLEAFLGVRMPAVFNTAPKARQHDTQCVPPSVRHCRLGQAREA
jgi:hypothetical protein